MKENKFKDYMKEKNFYPSKKMGQNFLINQNIKEKIVDSIDIDNNDFVVEIGPGFGALTKIILSKTNNLKLIELDKRLVEFLRNEYPQIELFNEDVLKFDFSKINENEFKLISNLPYSVSSKVILKVLKYANFKKAVFMIQKEMAERIVAKCGTKKYNNFSVLLSITANIKKLFDVSPTCFYPKPEVNSSVISFEKNKDFDFENFEKLEKFLLMVFSQKRKTIFNNLKKYYDLEKINNILKEFNIDPETRPEKIEAKVYEKMYLKFYEN